MNQHNPPTDRDVKIVYAKTITRLRADNDCLRTQRDEVILECRALIESAWYPGKERVPVIERAEHTLKVIDEYKETEGT